MIFVKTKDIQLSPKEYEKIASETSSRKDAIFKVTDELARHLTNYFNNTNELIETLDEDSEIVNKIVSKLKLDNDKVYSIIKVSLPLFNNLFNEIVNEKEKENDKTEESNKINPSTSDGYYSRIDSYRDAYKYTKDNEDDEDVHEVISYPKIKDEEKIEDLIDDESISLNNNQDDVKKTVVENISFNDEIDPLSLIEPIQEYKEIKEIEEPEEEKKVYHKPAKALVLEEIKEEAILETKEVEETKEEDIQEAKEDIVQEIEEKIEEEPVIGKFEEPVNETYDEAFEKARNMAINELKPDNKKLVIEVENTTSNEPINNDIQDSNKVIIVQNQPQKGYFRVFSVKDFIDSKSSKSTRSVLTGIYTLIGILIAFGLISSIIVAIYVLFIL